MKKLLSILGAVGLVATASTSVVACGSKTSNNPNYGYKDFEGWVNESKKDNINEIIFIGGRKDVDTLSFLAAREKVSGMTPNVSDITKLTNDKLSKNADDKFNEWLSSSSDASAIKTVSENADTYLDTDSKSAFESTLVNNYFWDNKNNELTVPSGIKLHSILVDDISTFFNNGLGKDIIDKFIEAQIEGIQKFSYSDEWDSNSYKNKYTTDKQRKQAVDNTKKGMASTLQNNKGPYFLVISKGKLAGITSGYKNYYEFDNTLDKNTDDNMLNKSASSDINALFNNFGDSVWKELYGWLQNNWFPGENGSSNFVVNNGTSISAWKNDKVGTNKTYTPPTNNNSNNSGTSNTGSDASNNGSGTDGKSSATPKQSFAVDLKKYIN